MKKKLKLPFVQLEKELYEVISAEELRTIIGGVDESMLLWNTDSEIVDSLNTLVTGGYFDSSAGSGSGVGAVGGSGGSGSGTSSLGSIFGINVGVGSGSGGTSPKPLVLSGAGANVSIERVGGSWKVTVNLGGGSVSFSGPLNMTPNGSHSGGGSSIPGTSSPNNLGIKINF